MAKEDYIRCKYCSHFQSGANRCHLGSEYDRGFAEAGERESLSGSINQPTGPGNRCAHFDLIAMEVIVRSTGESKRPDGSPIVDLDDCPELKEELVRAEKKASGGCYVATAVYGSYDCPQVWTLRRYRDDTLAKNWYGRAFIRTYYAVSPTIVKWFGNTLWFRKLWRGKLDRIVKKLQDSGVESGPYADKAW